MSAEFNFNAEISFIDIRESLPSIDPECLSAEHVLEIILYAMRQKRDFKDRGHEINNKETAWVNGHLLRLKPEVNDTGMPIFIIINIGSSIDKIGALS